MKVRANNLNQKHIKQIIKRCNNVMRASIDRNTRSSSEPVLDALIYQRILPHIDERAGAHSIQTVTCYKELALTRAYQQIKYHSTHAYLAEGSTE